MISWWWDNVCLQTNSPLANNNRSQIYISNHKTMWTAAMGGNSEAQFTIVPSTFVWNITEWQEKAENKPVLPTDCVNHALSGIFQLKLTSLSDIPGFRKSQTFIIIGISTYGYNYPVNKTFKFQFNKVYENLICPSGIGHCRSSYNVIWHDTLKEQNCVIRATDDIPHFAETLCTAPTGPGSTLILVVNCVGHW